MNIYIKAIAGYLPEKIVTNDALVERFPEWNVEKIVKKVGIEQRHVAAADETAGDMAVKAANILFEQSGISPAEIDFVMLCTQSPDYHLPTTACIIQDRLGVPVKAGAIDYNLGCSGYVYGLALAKGLVCAGIARNVLLLTAETYSKYTHPSDKGNLSIFGDGASATVVSDSGKLRIGEFCLRTDGSGARNLMVESGCSRHPEKFGTDDRDESGALHAPDYLYMNGSEIFNFSLEKVPVLVEDTLAANGLDSENVGLYVFHQANKFMLTTLRKVCAIPKEQLYINLADKGNTVSSTIPLALIDALADNSLRDGMHCLIAGFGVGLSWGATVLTVENSRP